MWLIKEKLILAIDPWVRKLWYALVRENFEIADAGILLQEKKSPTRIDQFERMQKIYEFFSRMLTEVDIKLCVLEKLFFTSSNQTNAEFVYGIRWMLIALMLSKWIEIKEYAPIELKKFITGNGKADKLFVQKMIMKIYKLEALPKYNDAADALWLAYIGARTLKSKR